MGFILCIYHGNTPSDLWWAIANVCHPYYRESETYYSGSNNSFQSKRQRAAQWRPGMSIFVLPLSFCPRKKSLCYPIPSICLELFSLDVSIKFKRERAKNCIHCIIFLLSLPCFALSKWFFSLAATEGITLVCCTQFDKSYILYHPVVSLCCFLWHYNLTSLEYRYLDSLVVIFILWPTKRERFRTVISNHIPISKVYKYIYKQIKSEVQSGTSLRPEQEQVDVGPDPGFGSCWGTWGKAA